MIVHRYIYLEIPEGILVRKGLAKMRGPGLIYHCGDPCAPFDFSCIVEIELDNVYN